MPAVCRLAGPKIGLDDGVQWGAIGSARATRRSKAAECRPEDLFLEHLMEQRGDGQEEW